MRLLAAAALATVSLSKGAAAQVSLPNEGALFLLLPVGAQSVGMGQAVVADRHGSEGVWWNPASLAHAEKREAAIHHSQSVIGTGDAVTLLIPSSLLGVLAASVNILDYGPQQIVPSGGGGEPIGTILPRSFIFAGTYATGIGAHVSAGITYKVLQLRVDCTGPCPSVPTFSASTSALDLGAQFDFGKRIPVVIGVAVRNLGLSLQVNDNPQADPLPKRIQAGVRYVFTVPPRYARDVEVHTELDVLDNLALGNPSARFGTDVVWQKRAHLRLGYVFDSPDGASPSVGLGVVLGRFSVDIARILSGLSADAGQAPTYLSLRYLF